MKKRAFSALCSILLFFTLVNVVKAEDDFLFTQFLETPLLILTALIIIDIIAFIYHKIRK